jgi:hypothetical protein
MNSNTVLYYNRVVPLSMGSWRCIVSDGRRQTRTPEEERAASVALERAIYGDLFPDLFPTGNNSSVAVVTLN